MTAHKYRRIAVILENDANGELDRFEFRVGNDWDQSDVSQLIDKGIDICCWYSRLAVGDTIRIVEVTP